MAKRRRKRNAPQPVAKPPPRRSASMRLWLLAAAVGLFVARPLVPPESIEQTAAGLSLTMCWLLLAVAWPVTGWLRGASAERFRKTDWAVVLLVIAFSVSGLWAIVHGAPRPAINATWQWINFGLSFLLIRQFVRSAREARAVVAVMIALAVALSAYGLYQYAFELPAMRQEFAENPDEVLRQQGIEPGSTAHRRLEDRIASTEPFATFALTNSLAGFLVPWLTVVAGLGVCALGAGRGPRIPSWVVMACCAIPLVGCLLMTKSRSGYLAAGVGFGLAGVLLRRERVHGHRRGAMIWGLAMMAVAVGTLIVVATVSGGLDLPVVTEASKSLGYRGQYWQSSLAMIADYPVLGCGPGNYQDTYTQVKLPRAAEEIADPHNFIFEVWATGGTLSLLACLAVAVCFSRELLRRPAVELESHEKNSETDSVQFIFAGAAIGVLASAPLSLIAISGVKTAALIITLIVGAGTLALLHRWIVGGRMPAAVPACGAVALLVHLLASGGIGIPAVAGSLWLMMGLSLYARREGDVDEQVSRPASAAAAVVGGLLVLACFLSAYRPVMTSHAASAAAPLARQSSRMEGHLKDATAADPLAAGPQRALAQWYFLRWQQQPDVELFNLFADANDRGLQLSPRSSAAWRQSGNWYRDVYQSSGQQEHIQRAVDDFGTAVKLYPHSASLRGQLAVTLEMASRQDEAKSQSVEALRLDEETPHADQKVPGELRTRLLRIVGAAQ